MCVCVCVCVCVCACAFPTLAEITSFASFFKVLGILGNISVDHAISATGAYTEARTAAEVSFPLQAFVKSCTIECF